MFNFFKSDKKTLPVIGADSLDFIFSFPLPVCLADSNGIIIAVNKQVENLAYYAARDIIGKPIAKLFFEKEEVVKMAGEAARQEGIQNREFNLVRKDGRRLPVIVSASVKEDKEGKFSGYYFIIMDLSKYKNCQTELEEEIMEKEKQLREEQQRMVGVISNLSDGLLIFDNKNKLSFINPSAEALLKVEGKNVLNRHITGLSDYGMLGDIAVLLGGGIKELKRYRLSIKGNGNLVFEISSSSLFGQDRKVGSLVIIKDVTQEKLVEKIKTDFIMLSAHQLRTPISAVKWILKMFLEGDLGKIKPEQKEFIEKAYKSNERMVVLVNDLLNVSKIEEGKYLYNPKLSKLEDIVQIVFDFYRDEFDDKKIDFEYKKTDKDFPLTMLDVDRIKLVVQNFVDNALKYTESGGKVTIATSYDKNNVGLMIEDTGAGIPAEQQKRVFSNFFRGSNVMKMETEGSGLGLYVSKNIIEAHGGRVWFESKENKGSKFYFSIPVRQEFSEFLTPKFY